MRNLRPNHFVQDSMVPTHANGRIHRYGASIFGDIIINVSKSINKEK